MRRSATASIFRQGHRLVLPAALLLSFAAPMCFAQSTGKINDTGLTTCADATSNSLLCGDASGDAFGYPWQDGQLGRSPKDGAGLTKTGASDVSSKGFDYQKLAYTGGAVVLAATALGTAAGQWGCTKDVVTGLIWDMKVTTAANLRLNTNTYSWNSADGTRNGGVSGTAAGGTCSGSVCDTAAFITAVNLLNICGETTDDWRLPTRSELMGIVNASTQATGTPTVDPTYFPNVQPGRYWTRDNVAGNPGQARVVNMGIGSDSVASKAVPAYVILVRP